MKILRAYKKEMIFWIFFLVFGLTLGYFVQLKIEKENIRSAVKSKIIEGIDRSELTFIAIDQTNDRSFSWIDDGEFELYGRKYDLVEITNTPGQEGYWCWMDEEESEVEEKIEKLLAKLLQQNHPNKNREEALQTFLKSLFYAHQPIELDVDSNVKLCWLDCSFYPINQDFLPPTPPPET